LRQDRMIAFYMSDRERLQPRGGVSLYAACVPAETQAPQLLTLSRARTRNV
jgi:hypothetical protein